ncbi:unnamed protein product [Dracunculus medinensis]|uniref:Uncharacterized protein n=1 Tax=Dracunculus medinensis TaxID=318479 RepID=A0A0N4U9A6_DRAME|nr:unnamed protein product [Dracunculus medinensis]
MPGTFKESNHEIETQIASPDDTEEAIYKYYKTKEIFREASMNEFNKRIPEDDLNGMKKESFFGFI